jgi:hypothetical protein
MTSNSIVSPTQSRTPVACDSDGANWMTAGAAVIGNKPFRELTLPASHDSGMHVVEGTPVNVLLLERSTRTQQLDLYQQIIDGGARVIDLRPVLYSHSLFDLNVPSGYYAGHWSSLVRDLWGGLIGQSLPEICADLRRALADLGSGETLIIAVSHGTHLREGGPFTPLSPADQSSIIGMLLAACEGHLYTAPDADPVDFFDLTPNDLAARGAGASALLSIQDESFGQCGKNQSDGCFPPTAFRTYSTWAGANTNDVDAFMKGIQDQLVNYHGSAGPLYLSWQLTWQIDKPWQSLREFAAVLNPLLPGRLQTWQAHGDITAASRPAVIGYNFLTDATGPDGTGDPVFAACLAMNGLPYRPGRLRHNI